MVQQRFQDVYTINIILKRKSMKNQYSILLVNGQVVFGYIVFSDTFCL